MRGLFTSLRGLKSSLPLNKLSILTSWGTLDKVHRTKHSINLMAHEYEVVVDTLNSLQSNAAVLEKARLMKDRQALTNVPCTEKYLNRVGIKNEDLEKLKIIHVAGTKGKGSTCAFCESILRFHGKKTGFYSSPHLIEVRERIRINGKAIDKELFVKYFWEVYTPLKLNKEHDGDMPAYFKFLTIMAFHVFIKENVDVAIVEVGIGGLYDCTNVIKKPKVVGITSLGLDHISLLGETVEKIAVHKAGIMKTGVPTFTVQDQPDNSLDVLIEQAYKIQSPLYIVPTLDEYLWAPYQIKVGLCGQVQWKNASLALQLCHAFLNYGIASEPIISKSLPLQANPFQIQPFHALGLASTVWAGRSQILSCSNMTYYIDGAHTPESIAACADWFLNTSNKSETNRPSRSTKVLVFNTTGDRNSSLLLLPLKKCNFDTVIFCPNVVEDNATAKDFQNNMVTKEQQLQRCKANRDTWLKDVAKTSLSSNLSHDNVHTLPTIQSALSLIQQMASNKNNQLDVLITGSLHLVGGALFLLDPKQMTKDCQPDVALPRVEPTRDNYHVTSGIL